MFIATFLALASLLAIILELHAKKVNLSFILGIITTPSILDGSFCGNHLSPISDISILSSPGSKCEHLNYFYNRLFYGIIIAGISIVAYIIAGIAENRSLGLGCEAFILLMIVVMIKNIQDRKGNRYESK